MGLHQSQDQHFEQCVVINRYLMHRDKEVDHTVLTIYIVSDKHSLYPKSAILLAEI